MIKVVLIRHSKTQGNLEGRYIGTTDEHLCNEGISIIKDKIYPEVQALYCSPMIRCKETAKLIYSNLEYTIKMDLRECAFGDFENKNYEELKNNDYYQKWIDSNGTLPFPNGEDSFKFRKRSLDAFDEIIDESIKNKAKSIAIIVHGGTIMSILDKYSYPHEDFYSWQVKNGCGYSFEIDEEQWKSNNKLVKNIVSI